MPNNSWLLEGWEVVAQRRIEKPEVYAQIPPSDSSECAGQQTCNFVLVQGDYLLTVRGYGGEVEVAARRAPNKRVLAASTTPEVLANAKASPSGALDYGEYPEADVISPVVAARKFPWGIFAFAGMAAVGLALED